MSCRSTTKTTTSQKSMDKRVVQNQESYVESLPKGRSQPPETVTGFSSLEEALTEPVDDVSGRKIVANSCGQSSLPRPPAPLVQQKLRFRPDPPAAKGIQACLEAHRSLHSRIAQMGWTEQQICYPASEAPSRICPNLPEVASARGRIDTQQISTDISIPSPRSQAAAAAAAILSADQISTRPDRPREPQRVGGEWTP